MTKRPRKKTSTPADWPASHPAEMIPLEKITPHPKNPRVHPDGQITGLGASFEEFGVVIPPIVDEDFRLIAGEGRWVAAQKKGYPTLPCIVVRGWSEKKKLRFMIADNRLPMLASFDDGLYRAALAAIKDEGLLEAIGFDEASIAAALAAQNGNNANAEWEGMPEFDQQDKTAFRSIVVHFKDQAALDKFLKATKMKVTENTRYLWFPEIEIERLADKRYSAEPAPAK